MNGGGKPGLRRVFSGEADLEGSVGYRASLTCKAVNANSSVIVTSATYAGRPLSPVEGDVEFEIIDGINILSFLLSSPQDQNVGLFEKDVSGHNNLLLHFQYNGANQALAWKIRGVEA